MAPNQTKNNWAATNKIQFCEELDIRKSCNRFLVCVIWYIIMWQHCMNPFQSMFPSWYNKKRTEETVENSVSGSRQRVECSTLRGRGRNIWNDLSWRTWNWKDLMLDLQWSSCFADFGDAYMVQSFSHSSSYTLAAFFLANPFDTYQLFRYCLPRRRWKRSGHWHSAFETLVWCLSKFSELWGLESQVKLFKWKASILVQNGPDSFFHSDWRGCFLNVDSIFQNTPSRCLYHTAMPWLLRTWRFGVIVDSSGSSWMALSNR